MKQKINIALGKERAELVFKNAKVVDVFCHRIIECDVAVSDGYIVGLGEYEGVTQIDASGKYLMPSFIDSHMHIESSMLTPSEYAKAVVPRGVTGVVADPHEIVNVCGENGLAFMVNEASAVPMDFYFMCPSCVPATKYDHSGCTIDSKLTAELISKYRCMGLGELMDFNGLLAGEEDLLQKVSCTTVIDGHSPLLTGKQLNAYIDTGVMTDHECESAEEAIEKISKGMFVHLREGTGAKNLEALVRAVNPYTLQCMTFCTDDKHIDDIVREGTISHCVNKAISLGVEALDAITMATINVAKCYGIVRRGAIAPGYHADLLLCGDLSAGKILEVYKDGRLAAKDGEALFDGSHQADESVTNTVNIKELTELDLQLDFNPEMPVIELIPDSLITKKTYASSPAGLCVCAVIERHKATGNIGKAYLKDAFISGGAVAQSIGHDSHNITVVGDNSSDMLLAVNALGKNGGICVVQAGRVSALLPLPIAGLMSDRPMAEVYEGHKAIIQAMDGISVNASSSLLMVLSFLTLLVIPEIKINDGGLFDVSKQCYINESSEK